MKKTKVLMVGTHINTMGGIASVIRGYKEYGIFDRLNIDYLATHKDGTKVDKMIFYAFQLNKYLLSVYKYKIIHIHTSQGWSFRRLFVVFMIAHLIGKRTILHVHGSDFDEYFDESNTFEKNLIKYALRNAGYVIALSTTWDDKLRNIEPRITSAVIQNTVNVQQYAVKDRVMHLPVKVLFLGRLGKRKGVYDIIDAVNYLDKSRFEIVLAGDGEIEEIKSIVKSQNLDKCVNVPGWVGLNDKARLLRESDIYILPSYHEGLPVGILEAISAGLPVISTTVGGIPDAVIDGHNGFLINPGDSGLLAEKLMLLSEDKRLWRRLSESSYRLALEKYSMEKAEAQLKEIYRSFESRVH